MKTKALAFIAAAATVALLFAVPAAPSASAAAIDLGVRVNVGPPPVRHEVVITRPGRDYVWVPGYWNWEPARNNYVWVGGVWSRPPYRHAVWVGPRWVHRGHDTFFVRGHWRH